MNPNLATNRISVFLSVDKRSLDQYFNPHDPAPIYKRQLRFDFVQYLNDSVATYRRHSAVLYKLTYRPEDFAIVEPFMHAIHQHFHAKEQLKRREFYRFKKGSYKLLFLSLGMLMFCHALMIVVLPQGQGFLSSLNNGLEVFSWVIMWRPIDRLIFQWNQYLKDISLLHKMATAEVIEIEAESDMDMEIAPISVLKDLLRA